MQLIQSLTRVLPPGVRSKLATAVRKAIVSQGFVPYDAKNHYAEDGLYTIHNDAFRRDPRFRAAYERGIRAGDGVDQHLEWRVHVALWAASTALHVPGDFVECGVNAGFVSSAIMQRLNWASLPRTYYLVDTFAGPVIEQYSEAEQQAGMTQMVERAREAGAYVTDVNRARSNFAEWPNAVVVQGAVPEVLPRVPASQVAFLHLDMNCAMPERAALEHFWPLLSRAAVVLLDDYAYAGHGNQKDAMDAAAAELGAGVLSLPTGQGLIVR
jgi:hypothetical protein